MFIVARYLFQAPDTAGGEERGVNSNLPTAERARLRGQIQFDRALRRRRFHRKAGGRHLFLFRADGSGFYVRTNENCPNKNNKDANFRGKFPRQHFCLGAWELRARSPRTHTHAEGWSGRARGALPLSSAFSCSACPRFRLIPRLDSIFMVRLVAFGCVLESAGARWCVLGSFREVCSKYKRHTKRALGLGAVKKGGWHLASR